MADDLEVAGKASAVEVQGLIAELERAETAAEVRLVFDRAQALVDVAKRARVAEDQLRLYAEVSLRAQRRGGEMLKATPRAVGRDSASAPSLATLLELPHQKARHLAEDWLKVAEIPEYMFENYLARHDAIPTHKGLLRFRGPGPKRPAHRPRRDGAPSPEPVSEPRKGLRLVPDKETERPTAVHPSILAAQAEAWNACVAWFARHSAHDESDIFALAEAANPYDPPQAREGSP
jgi:hypothetical protein